MRFLKWALYTVLGILGVCVIALAGTILWVYLNPAGAWRFAEKHVLPKDLKIAWQDLNVNVDHTAVLSWQIDMHFKDLTLKKESPKLDFDLEKLSVSARVSVLYPKTDFELKEMTVNSDKPNIFTATEDKVAEEKPFDPQETLKQIDSMIKTIIELEGYVKIGYLNVDVSDFQYRTSSGPPMRAAIKLMKGCSGACRVSFDLKTQNVSIAEKASLIGSADLRLYESGEKFIDATLVATGKDLNVKIPFYLIRENGKIHFSTDADVAYRLTSGWLKINPKIRVASDSEELDLDVKSDFSGIPGPIPRIDNFVLKYHLPFGSGSDWAGKKSELSLVAPIPLKYFEQKCRCKIAPSLKLKINSDIWLARYLKPSEDPIADADIRLDSVSNDIFAFDLGATLKIARRRGSWSFEPTLDSTAKVKDFHALQKILNANHVMVPAPFAVLRGTLGFEAKAPVLFERQEEKWSATTAKAKLQADLKSPRQQVNFDTGIELRASSDFKTIDILLDAVINDFQVELPPLNPVSGLPSLVHDSRIQITPQKVVTPAFKMTFGFKVKTAKPGAVRLLSKLADPYIPITIQYDSRNKGTSGDYLKIEAFKIKYLRRVLFVDSVRLDLDELNGGDFPLLANMHVQQTEYRVDIRVAGTTKSPKLELSSDPYLERADIISVLLYDRPQDQLVGGDAETSGNVQAAVADRAIGLVGLWAFAATPIRSFSYNSITKVYSATIVLGDGLTAGIGTGLDDYTSFEVRKRLSKKWVIAASWTPSEAEENSGQVVLQWERRF